MRFKSKKRLLGALSMMCILFLAFSGTFPTMRTGAPGDNGTCQNCHSNNGGFTGQINMSGIPASVNGSDVLTITTEVEVLTGSPVRSGFSVVALDDTNDNQAGDWLSGDGSFQMSGGREYWGHQPALMFGGGSTVSWEADWEAPNITDDVTFYICAVLGNGSGTGGDRVECITETVSVSGAMPLSVIIDMESPATCEDSDNGSADAIASDGTPPYDYLWSNGETTAMAVQLETGSHTVTVTDDDGNTATATTFIDALFSLSLDADITHILCYDIPSGTIDVITSGGTAPYNCSWDALPAGCFHNNLSPGEYFVTVTDANGCTQEEVFDVEDIDPLDLNLIPTSESIPGAMDGSIITSVDGGSTPYNYLWSNGANTADLTGISAGVYSVTVTDDNSCTISATVTISTDSNPCTLSVQGNIMDASCYGGTGGIGLVVMGASGTVSYAWSNNTTGPSLANAPAGVYSVTVSDAANCEEEIIGMQISQPDSLALNLVSITDASCPGVGDGGLIVSAAGGVGNYVLSWAFGMTNDTIINGVDTLVNLPDTLTNLTAQIYPYSLVDGNGCITNGFYQVNATDNVSPTILLQQGQVILDANGNAPAADFSLVDGGSFDNCGISNIVFDTPAFTCADIGINNYTVFVSDASGNTSSATATIQVYETTPPVINCANSTISLNTCGAVNYTIPTATDNCDIPTVALFSGLQSGSMFPVGQSTVVYVATDECGNSSTCDFTVTVSNTLNAMVSTTPATCQASTGTLTITASGGTAPYTYQPFGSNTQGGLSAGSYSVTITDSAGCEIVQSATIGQADGPNVGFSGITPDGCDGAPIGTVSLLVTGGAAPYTLSVNNGVPVDFSTTTYTITQLGSGSVSITLTDANNCEFSGTVEIPTTQAPMVSLPDIEIACFMDSVLVDLSPANPNFSFEGFPRYVSNGQYSVIVTDNNGCTALSTFEVTSPAALVLDRVRTLETDECSFNITDVIAEVSGGVAPYDVLVLNVGPNTQGPYSVAVTDANGCNAKDTMVTLLDIILTEPLALQVDVDYDCDSTTVVNVISGGGCSPLTFEYTPVFDEANPMPGDYTLLVTDAQGTTIENQFSILENAPITDANVDIQIIGTSPGGINLDIEGGIAPYTFEWADEAGAVISNEQNLLAIVDSPQTVTLTVTDSLDCSATFMYFIDMEVATIDLDKDGSSVMIYPNPVEDKVHLEFLKEIPVAAEIFATDGALISKLEVDHQKMKINTAALLPGLYFIKLDYGDKVLVKQFMKI